MNRITFRMGMVMICLCAATMVQGQNKIVYIPKTFNAVGADDYCNKNGKNGTIKSIDDLTDSTERWCKARSYETNDVVCFWEAGFGTNPKAMKRPDGNGTFDLTRLLNSCDSILRYEAYTLGAIPKNSPKFDKYKFLFMLCYTSGWVSYGGGYDNVIGAMWLAPSAIGVYVDPNIDSYPYGAFAHEMFHAMSAQAYADRPSADYSAFNGKFAGPFWERSANNAASTLYPYISWDWARYAYATQSQFMSTRRHYAVSFLLEELRNNFGKDALGKIWVNNLVSEDHPMNTITRLFFNSSQAQTNDFIAKTAMKTITFDFPSNSEGWFEKTTANSSNPDNVENSTSYLDFWSLCFRPRFIPMAINYDSLHFAIRDCQAPQDYGFNVIRLYPQKRNADSTATVSIHFKGHLESAASELKKKSGWRWAFVSVSADGIPRYGAIHADADGVATYNMQADDKELYLVVTGAPTAQDANHLYHWEAGLVKYYRYPYEFRLQNAVPYGYNADYEVPQGITLHVHSNGGGLVARTASVAATAYVGPHAKVLGSARVTGNARIEDFAVVKGSAVVSDSAVVKENALVMSNAKVRGGAIVSGSARVMNSSVVSDTAFVTDNAFLTGTAISGNAIACGNLWQRDASPFRMSGTFIAGGDDESAGNSNDGAETKGTFLQWPEFGNNGRKRLDGRGNMSVMFIRKLRDNWNNLSIRYKILNSSCKENADVNLPYTPFADSELAVAAVAPDSVATFTVVRNGLPNGRYYVIDPKTGGFLTSDGKSAPVFAVRDASNAGQIWSIEKSQSLLKYCFRDSVGRTIHADGSISSTGTATSASYAFDLTQRVDQDLYSVYCKSTGYYWKVYGEKLRVKGFNIQNGYPLQLVNVDTYNTGVSDAKQAIAKVTYHPASGQIEVNTPEKSVMTVTSASGAIVAQYNCAEGDGFYTLPTLPRAVYIVSLQGYGIGQTLKLLVR